jgi:hypothetical protein
MEWIFMAKKKPKKKLTQNQQIYKQEVAKLKRIISLNLGKNRVKVKYVT